MPIHKIEDRATGLEFDRLEKNTRLPVGMVVEFYGHSTDIPLGWLALDGSLKDIYDYPILYETLFKAGRTSQVGNQFRVPTATYKMIKA